MHGIHMPRRYGVAQQPSERQPEVLKQTLYTVLPDNDHEEWLSPFQRMLREQRAEGLAEGEARGRAEGESRGSKATLVATLQQQLTQRFGPISDTTRARIESADAQQLQGWLMRVLDAHSIDATLAD